MAGTLAGIVAIYSAHAALPTNALALPLENKATEASFIPEGWSFFTASPREADILPYRHTALGWRSVGADALADPGNLFGLDRARRAQDTEVALLLADVPAVSWRSCQDLPKRCLDRLDASDTLNNSSASSRLCGDIGFVQQETLPWAWRNGAATTIMPSQVLRVSVACRT